MTQSTTKHYIEYFEGNLPIVISAPHGGDEKPKDIQTRTSGVFDKDDFTLELTHDIIKEFHIRTNATPYAVIATISREKVDINREVDEAYIDEKASIPYNQFHNLIKNSRKSIENRFGKGLYIDIHGQSHPKGYLEFGYLLFNDILKLHETQLREKQEISSIKTLSNFSDECFIDQLRGPHSLGSLMCNNGFDSIPSVKLPYASDGNYFEGAYDTIRYGSLDNGNISGIQIEFPYLGCRDTKENRQKCASALVDSILRFMEIHFQLDLKKL